MSLSEKISRADLFLNEQAREFGERTKRQGWIPTLGTKLKEQLVGTRSILHEARKVFLNQDKIKEEFREAFEILKLEVNLVQSEEELTDSEFLSILLSRESFSAVFATVDTWLHANSLSQLDPLATRIRSLLWTLHPFQMNYSTILIARDFDMTALRLKQGGLQNLGLEKRVRLEKHDVIEYVFGGTTLIFHVPELANSKKIDLAMSRITTIWREYGSSSRQHSNIHIFFTNSLDPKNSIRAFHHLSHMQVVAIELNKPNDQILMQCNSELIHTVFGVHCGATFSRDFSEGCDSWLAEKISIKMGEKPNTTYKRDTHVRALQSAYLTHAHLLGSSDDALKEEYNQLLGGNYLFGYYLIETIMTSPKLEPFRMKLTSNEGDEIKNYFRVLIEIGNCFKNASNDLNGDDNQMSSRILKIVCTKYFSFSESEYVEFISEIWNKILAINTYRNEGVEEQTYTIFFDKNGSIKPHEQEGLVSFEPSFGGSFALPVTTIREAISRSQLAKLPLSLVKAHILEITHDSKKYAIRLSPKTLGALVKVIYKIPANFSFPFAK